MAQYMLFAENVVKLVDIYGRPFTHSPTLNDVLWDFKRFMKKFGFQ